MRHEIINVTPKKAEQWLKKNIDKQRPLRDTVVAKYAEDMKAGRWEITHQGIAFDLDGNLIDGQHRLNAVIAADVNVRMSVVFDAPYESYDHLDIGQGRSHVDILRLRGEGWITHEHIAIARFVESGGSSYKTSTGLSVFQVQALVEKHKAAIEFVLTNLPRRIKYITVAPVLAAVASAYNFEAHDKLLRFLQVIVNGVTVTGEEAIIIRLRDKCVANGNKTSAKERSDLYLATQRAIYAYTHGEKLSKIYVPSEPCYKAK